jgi:hypothetical protein
MAATAPACGGEEDAPTDMERLLISAAVVPVAGGVGMCLVQELNLLCDSVNLIGKINICCNHSGFYYNGFYQVCISLSKFIKKKFCFTLFTGV